MKLAAIWARVSTEGQKELSLDGQVERVKAKLESLGYQVPPDNILKTTWTSLDLYSCPQFKQLQQWVKTKQIAALGVLDRDRLAAQGLQRLTFLADCKAAGVEVVTYQGVPMLEGPEGQLVELALAIGKQRSVERAQQGSRDGLRDRATLKGLPPSPKNPYGYQWTIDRRKLQRTKDWPNAELICKLALRGVTLGGICQELYEKNIPSPSGRARWVKQVISALLANPIYGGQFYALRRQECIPKKRRVEGYGKTSSRRKPLSEALCLPNIVVESPPLTWEEWQSVQKRLDQNKLKAQRNAKRDYLLRGLIFCETHRRVYHGRPHYGKWCYACAVCYAPGAITCPTPYLNGPKLETKIKEICREILTKPEIIEAEIAKRTGQVATTLEAILKKLTELDTKESKAKQIEANIIFDKASGDASPESYARALARVKAQKVWITEERERLQAELATVQHSKGVVVGLAAARERLYDLLNRGSNEDLREVFNALAVELRVSTDGKVEVSLAIPVTQLAIDSAVPEHG